MADRKQQQREAVLKAAVERNSDHIARLSAVRPLNSPRQLALVLSSYMDVDEDVLLGILKKCEGNAVINAQLTADPRNMAREVAASTMQLGYAIAVEQFRQMPWWRRIWGVKKS